MAAGCAGLQPDLLAAVADGPTAWRQEPATFRAWFICCAGKLVTHARRWTLKMHPSYHWCPQWEAIYQQVCRLQL